MKPNHNKSCTWSEDFDGNLETDCGNIYTIIEGTPSENEMKYCTYCGKKLEEKKYKSLRDALGLAGYTYEQK